MAVIGKDWIDTNSDQVERRLDDPKDFVRIEIESALKRGIPIIPLLVRGASMPPEYKLPDSVKELIYHNGTPIRPDPDFHNDVNRLIEGLEALFKSSEVKWGLFESAG